MAVDAGGRAMGGPSGVRNTGMVVKDLGEIWLLGLDELSELGDLADLFECEDLLLLVTVDSETGGVVASVL